MARAPTIAQRRAAMTRLMAWVALATFLLDQATKWLVVHRLDLWNRLEIDVWPGVLNLRMAWNQGINFGIGAGLDMRWVLVAVAVAVSAFVVLWVRRDGGGRGVHVAAGLLVGGALGNVVDRVLYGAVADFLNFPLFGEALGWARRLVLGGEGPAPQYSFNVADIAVFAGAAGLILLAGDGSRAQRARPPRGPSRRGPP